MDKLKNKVISFLRWSEKYTKTDMVYLTKSSFWLNLNVVIGSILAFVISIAYAKFLTKEVYGTYQFMISIASILGSLTLTGMNTAVTQSTAKGFEGSFKKSIIIQIKWSIIPILTSVFISAYYFLNHNLTLALAVIFIGFLQPILNTFNTYMAFIYGKKDFRRAFYFGQIFNIFYYPVMIASILLVKNAIYLVLANLLISIAASIFLHFYTINKFKPNDKEDPEAISFGKHMSLSNIIGTIASQIDNIFVFHYLGAVDLAIYAFASNIPERITSIIKNISIAALPKFSERNHEELRETIFSKSIKLTGFTFAITLIYIALSPWVFRIFFPEYAASVVYSMVYALMLVVAAASRLPMTVLMATGSKREMYIYNTAFSSVSIILMAISTMYFGIWGLISARGISNIFGFILLLFLIKNKK